MGTTYADFTQVTSLADDDLIPVWDASVPGVRAIRVSDLNTVISTFKDSVFRVYDNGDTTKTLAFQVSGVSANTTRTLTIPDASGEVALIDQPQTYTATATITGTLDISGGTLTLADDQISGDKVSGGTADGLSLDGAALVSGLNTNGQTLDDTNGNELLSFGVTASAVNHVSLTNAATGNGPTVKPAGDDTNADLNVEAKGTGNVVTSGMTWSTMG